MLAHSVLFPSAAFSPWGEPNDLRSVNTRASFAAEVASLRPPSILRRLVRRVFDTPPTALRVSNPAMLAVTAQ